MDYNQSGSPRSPARSSPIENDPLKNFNSDPLFSPFDYSNMCFDIVNSQFSPEFSTSARSSDHRWSYEPYRTNQEMKMENNFDPTNAANEAMLLEWNPRAVLSNLASMEQKIHQAQEVVRALVGRGELAAQQQIVTADVASILAQLISTASSILPSAQGATVPSDRLLGQLDFSTAISNLNGNEILFVNRAIAPVQEEGSGMLNPTADEAGSILIEEHDVKESEDGGECENLPAGSYVLLQLAKEEILAPHTHFCQICGKGFKRDANLRMHMRGHGDEYKTPASLAKPVGDSSSRSTPMRRYSCPALGCKRNKEHKKFQPLKTLLCVKNHYKRIHCDKSYTCSRCSKKKFSVLADLKTHEKNCGHNKWICSCGTTFSRKDKLFGHIVLFQGHTPALPMDSSIKLHKDENVDGSLDAGFDFGGNFFDSCFLDVKAFDEGSSFLQAAALDPSSLGEFHRFLPSSFPTSYHPRAVDCSRKDVGNSSADDFLR